MLSRQALTRRPKKTFSSNAKKRISFQAQTKTPDGEGGFTKTWTTSETLWSELNPLSATQVYDYKSIGVDATHEIVIRGQLNFNITDEYRAILGTRIFEIKTVENVQERDIVVLITAKERR